jgi:hypothetical protein
MPRLAVLLSACVFLGPSLAVPKHAESLRTDDARAAPLGAALTAVKCPAAAPG